MKTSKSKVFENGYEESSSQVNAEDSKEEFTGMMNQSVESLVSAFEADCDESNEKAKEIAELKRLMDEKSS
ncbi:MAG: hypothetical protein LBT50_04600 [Prevotellaceae bacterium]|jgi:hypothetical protein|nr:hypothetical protein [Prevotellaceae bacterium]